MEMMLVHERYGNLLFMCNEDMPTGPIYFFSLTR